MEEDTRAIILYADMRHVHTLGTSQTEGLAVGPELMIQLNLLSSNL